MRCTNYLLLRDLGHVACKRELVKTLMIGIHDMYIVEDLHVIGLGGKMLRGESLPSKNWACVTAPIGYNRKSSDSDAIRTLFLCQQY